jgi:hypothetical protein
MKLTELDARFLTWRRDAYPTDRFVDGIEHVSGFGDTYTPIETFTGAHGICFLCPKDFVKNGGREGTHSVFVWFEGSPVPPDVGLNKAGAPVRWKAGGTGLGDLSLSPSILEQDDHCQWHGFVTNGDATSV